MRIAFYAPLKPPEHPQPSGDRQMARLLIAALRAAGATVVVASRFRSFDADGDERRQARIAALGKRLADRCVQSFLRQSADQRPQLWFTYHLYHKAPDWLGPSVSRALGIPYVVAEASHAPKRSTGPWSSGYAAAAEAIAAADMVLGLNSADAECVGPLLKHPERLTPFAPFLDAAPFAAARRHRNRHRKALRRVLGLGDDVPLLLAVAMMRPGAKLQSYEILGSALARVRDRPWRLLVAGDGPAAPSVERVLAKLGPRLIRFGRVDGAMLPGLYAGCDLYVWPSVQEAYGLALLEAQAAGLPVIAGRTGGVPDIVQDGRTGLLVRVSDAPAFGRAAARMLDIAALRASMGVRAAAYVRHEHDLPRAAVRLHRMLAPLVGTNPTAC